MDDDKYIDSDTQSNTTTNNNQYDDSSTDQYSSSEEQYETSRDDVYEERSSSSYYDDEDEYEDYDDEVTVESSEASAASKVKKDKIITTVESESRKSDVEYKAGPGGVWFYVFIGIIVIAVCYLLWLKHRTRFSFREYFKRPSNRRDRNRRH